MPYHSLINDVLARAMRCLLRPATRMGEALAQSVARAPGSEASPELRGDRIHPSTRVTLEAGRDAAVPGRTLPWLDLVEQDPPDHRITVWAIGSSSRDAGRTCARAARRSRRRSGSVAPPWLTTARLARSDIDRSVRGMADRVTGRVKGRP